MFVLGPKRHKTVQKTPFLSPSLSHSYPSLSLDRSDGFYTDKENPFLPPLFKSRANSPRKSLRKEFVSACSIPQCCYWDRITWSWCFNLNRRILYNGIRRSELKQGHMHASYTKQRGPSLATLMSSHRYIYRYQYHHETSLVGRSLARVLGGIYLLASSRIPCSILSWCIVPHCCTNFSIMPLSPSLSPLLPCHTPAHSPFLDKETSGWSLSSPPLPLWFLLFQPSASLSTLKTHKLNTLLSSKLKIIWWDQN